MHSITGEPRIPMPVQYQSRKRVHRGPAIAIVLALMPLVSACDLDSLLKAEDPFTVTPDVARDTANLTTLYAGARAQFALAFGGLQNREGGIVMVAGLMSDELYSSDSFN